METLTVEFIGEHGRGFATQRTITPLEAMAKTPMMRIGIGFQSITLPRALLGEMLRQLQMAEVSGLEYPDDAKGLAEAGYGLKLVDPNQSHEEETR